MNTPILVVAGAPGLAAAFASSGVAAGVLPARDGAELLALVRGEKLAGKKPGDVVFFVADNLEPAAQMPLADFLRRVTSAGYRTVVLAVTTRGADLQQQAPQSGLLPVPVTLNAALFALNAYGYSFEPHPEGFADLDLTGVTPPRAAQPAAQPAAASPTPAPAPAAPATPKAGGWRKPSDPAVHTAPKPAANVPASPRPERDQTALPTPAPEPVAASPAVSPGPAPFVPDEPVPAPTPFAPAPAPAPVPFPAAPTPARTPFSPASSPYAPAPAPFSPAPVPGAVPSPLPYSGGAYPATAPAAGPVLRDGSQIPGGMSTRRRGMVIAVTAAKGGTGKSSLSINAAAFLGMKLRSQGRTVCLIDANYQQADAGRYLNVFNPNVTDVAKDPTRYLRPEALATVLTHFSAYNLSVLLGPKSPNEGSPTALTPRLYTDIVNVLRESFDYLILDLPVAEKFHSLFADFALPIADYIVVPVIPNVSTLLGVNLWLNDAVVSSKAAGGAGKDRSSIGIVLNRAEEGIGCSVEQVRSALSNWNFLGAIPESKQWKAANNHYELVVAKNYPELNQAFSEILYQVTGEPVLAPTMNPNLEEPERPSRLKSLLGRRKRDN